MYPLWESTTAPSSLVGGQRLRHGDRRREQCVRDGGSGRVESVPNIWLFVYWMRRFAVLCEARARGQEPRLSAQPRSEVRGPRQRIQQRMLRLEHGRGAAPPAVVGCERATARAAPDPWRLAGAAEGEARSPPPPRGSGSGVPTRARSRGSLNSESHFDFLPLKDYSKSHRFPVYIHIYRDTHATFCLSSRGLQSSHRASSGVACGRARRHRARWPDAPSRPRLLSPQPRALSLSVSRLILTRQDPPHTRPYATSEAHPHGSTPRHDSTQAHTRWSTRAVPYAATEHDYTPRSSSRKPPRCAHDALPLGYICSPPLSPSAAD